MSTLKVTNIESPSGGGVNAKITDINGGQLSNRNLFVNGGARIAQRGTSETGVTSSGYKTVDQFKMALTSLGTWTVTQETDAPAGFSNSLKMDCTTADSSPAAGDVCAIDTFIEAQNLQVLEYGSASAVAATLSFYVKSNKTGSGTVSILQADNSNRCINVSYTISSANTWERKTISLPADASGVINNDTGRGLMIEYWLNSGSTYTGGSAQTTWGSLDNNNRNFANLGIGGSTDDYWMITGVQLEVGEVATAFEHKSYADDLQRCLRYAYVLGSQNVTDNYERFDLGICNSSTSTRIFVKHPVVMRTAPTVSTPDASQWQVSDTMNGYDASALSRMSSVNGPLQTSIQVTHASGATTNRVYILERNNSTSGRITFSSEL
jgi:hypothetical protein